MRNKYLDHDVSDSSDNEAGYDSEAAEISKAASSERVSKRRKTLHSDVSTKEDVAFDSAVDSGAHQSSINHKEVQNKASITLSSPKASKEVNQDLTILHHKKSSNKHRKPKTSGVIYLSSLPPYLQPSALRTLLSNRGFSPITRLFLSPAPSPSGNGKKSSTRKRYSEGWIEFESKKTARRCEESLNATRIGGKKGNKYYDDIWNMKYLKGMAWGELMAGVRGEKREEEARRDEERRTLKKEIGLFMEGVERGKMVEGMDRKTKGKVKGEEGDAVDDGGGKRVWRQFEVNGCGAGGDEKKEAVGDDAKMVLGRIFG